MLHKLSQLFLFYFLEQTQYQPLCFCHKNVRLYKNVYECKDYMKKGTMIFSVDSWLIHGSNTNKWEYGKNILVIRVSLEHC